MIANWWGVCLDLIRAEEAWHAEDTAAAMINNIPRTYDRAWL